VPIIHIAKDEKNVREIALLCSKNKQTEKPKLICISIPKTFPMEPESRTEVLIFTYNEHL